MYAEICAGWVDLEQGNAKGMVSCEQVIRMKRVPCAPERWEYCGQIVEVEQ